MYLSRYNVLLLSSDASFGQNEQDENIQISAFGTDLLRFGPDISPIDVEGNP